MGDHELKVKIVPDLAELRKQLAGLGFTSKAGAGGGGGGDEPRKQTSILGDIAKGVFAGTAAIKIASFVLTSIEPFIRPILQMLQIMVFLILLPLFPLLKLGMSALAEFIKGMASGKKTPEDFDTEEFKGKGFIEQMGVVLFNIPEALTVLWNRFTGFLGDLFNGFVETLRKAVTDPLGFLLGLGGWIWETLTGVLGSAIELLADVGRWFWDLLTGILTGAVQVLSNLGKWFWDLLIGIINLSVQVLTGLGGWLWTLLTDLINATVQVMSGFGSWLWETLTNLLSNGLNALIGLGGWLLGQIQSVISGAIDFIRNNLGALVGKAGAALGGIFGGVGSKKGDFLMRPGQAPVEFSSGDTIIGAKNPSAIGGGGGNITYAPVYHVDAGADSEKMRKMFEEHDREFLTRLRNLGTFGGRFMG